MKQLKKIFTSGLVILALYLAVILTALVALEMRPVRADMVSQTAVTTIDNTEYLRLTDAPPVRDITGQRIAPLEVTP